MVFGIDFGCLMARFLGPTWPPKSNKIGPKSASRCTSFGTSFLGTLWVRFWDQLGANRTQKSLIFHYVGIHFKPHLGANMAPLSTSASTQICLKMGSKSHANFDGILNSFLSFSAPFGPIFGAKLGGKKDQKSIQDSIDKAMKK